MPRQSLRNRATATESAEAKTATNGTTASKVGAKAEVIKREADEPSVKEEDEEESEEEQPKTSRKRKAPSVKVNAKEEDEEEAEEPKTTKKRKTTKGKAKAEDTMPLAERTAISSLKNAMHIGAHVSGAGGVQNSIGNAVHIGANSFALFLKSQRKWDNPPIAPEARDGFMSLSKQHNFEVHKHCLPHGSYLVNLAAREVAKADQAYKAFLDDLQRCETLGIKLYNFHPGNTNGEPRDAAIKRIATQLNKSHKATKTVITVLENMAGQGNVIGTTFEDLRDIIELIDDKSRVGVCIDSCHAFAAGYDIRSPEAFTETIGKFNDTVGAHYLKAFHLNDSKAPLSSHRDLHANIGTGFLGLRAFHNIMNHAAFSGLPMVLETPIDKKGVDGKSFEDKKVWADEIKLLEGLIGMDPEGEEFKILDEKLQADGQSERKKVQDQVDRKAVKDAKKGTKGKRGKKKQAEIDDESASE